MFSSLSTETSKHIVSKIIFLIVLGLAFGGLVLMDVRGVMSSGVGVQDAASVNGERITTRTLLLRAQDMGRRMGMPAEQAAASPQLLQYTLQGLVTDELAAQGLKKMGLIYSDKDVANQVRSMLTDPNDKSGGTDMVQRYEMALRNAGMTQADFENQVRRDLARQTVLEALKASSLPDPLIASFQKAFGDERRDLIVITVPNKPEAVKGQPSDADLQQIYAGNEAAFAIPEKRSATVYNLSAAALKEKGKDDPQSYVMEIEDAFASGDELDSVAKQYGLGVAEKVTDVTEADAADNKTAKDIYAMGDLQVSNGMTQENGDTHFIAITGTKLEGQKPLSDVRDQLVTMWKAERAQDAARKIVAALTIAKDPVAEAKKDGLPVQTLKGVKISKEYQALFSTIDMNKAQEFSTGNNDFKVGVVTAIMPGTSDWKEGAASTDEFRKASEIDPQSAFTALLERWFMDAKIKVNNEAISALLQQQAQPQAPAQ